MCSADVHELLILGRAPSSRSAVGVLAVALIADAMPDSSDRTELFDIDMQ